MPNNMVRQFLSGGVYFRCKGEPTTMVSDSAAWYQDLNRVDFVGRVHFKDTSVTLDADRASYYLKDERLEAYQHVALVNRSSGSRLNGTNLIYRRVAKGVRDTSELFARERPTVRYRSEKDSAGAEPYVILGDMIRMKGDAAAWGSGTVTIDRSDFHALGDSTSLDLNAGVGQLVGHAHVGGKDSSYALAGRLINYRLKDRKLTFARADGLAQATSSDWRLDADTIQFTFAADKIQSGTAWGDSIRPRALSLDQTITADSLVIEAPGQQLQEVRGIRSARATSKSDSLGLTPPNWMVGDTVVARFDSTDTGKRYLAHLEAQGHAAAFYHIFGDDKTKDPAISYNRGTRIAAALGPEGMRDVSVVGGDPNGVYLEPLPKKLDTLAVKKADSLAVKPTGRRGGGGGGGPRR
jgi:hypothetical protein